MAATETANARFSRAEATMVLVYAVAAFVAGAGIMIDAEPWVIDAVGQTLAWIGILGVMGWFVARGTRLRIVYPVMITLISAFIFRNIPSGGISAKEVLAMVIATCGGLSVLGIGELRDRRKKERAGANSGKPDTPQA